MDRTPFRLNEVRISLFNVLDIDQLILYYPAFKGELDSEQILQMLSKRFRIPYKIVTYKQGIPTTERLINSLEDLVFEYDLRDPIQRQYLCLSHERMMKIAIKEQDLPLLKDLVAEYHQKTVLSVSRSVYRVAGETGNDAIIKFLLEDFPQIEPIIEGLLYNHHNDLFDKYVSIYSDRLLDIVEGSAEGNNIEIFVQYYPEIVKEEMITLSLFYAGMHNSRDVIGYILKHAKLSDDDYLHLLQGYLYSCNIDKAKEIYDKISPEYMNRQMNKTALIETIMNGGCKESYEFVNEIVGGISKEQLIDNLPSIRKLSKTAWYVINLYPDLWKVAFTALMYSDETEDLIRIVEKFDPKFLDVEELMYPRGAEEPPNRCFEEWLDKQRKT